MFFTKDIRLGGNDRTKVFIYRDGVVRLMQSDKHNHSKIGIELFPEDLMKMFDVVKEGYEFLGIALRGER